MLALGRKFSPNLSAERILAAVDQGAGRFAVIALDIEYLSGKRDSRVPINCLLSLPERCANVLRAHAFFGSTEHE